MKVVKINSKGSYSYFPKYWIKCVDGGHAALAKVIESEYEFDQKENTLKFQVRLPENGVALLKFKV